VIVEVIMNHLVILFVLTSFCVISNLVHSSHFLSMEINVNVYINF